MSEPTPVALAAQLAVAKAKLEVLKASFNSVNRWPAGSSKGGQFAPKGGTGVTAPQLGLGGNTWKEGGWAGSGMWSQPKAPPPGAKPHPQKDDKGNPVSIDYPTPASPASTWSNPKAVATFTPNGNTPEVLNGVPFKSWKPPKEGWASVKGTNEKLDQDFPFEPHPTKKTGAGVIILEPDGRVWLTKPTNEFGNYKQTFPKGTAESGLTLQQNAIKEAYEETGLKVKIVGIAADIERDTSKARFYFARRVGGTPKDMGWESQALRLAPRKQAMDLLNRTHDKQLLADVLDEMGIRKAKGDAKESGKPGAWQFQERWPAGSSLGGQWKAMGADGITAPPKIAGGLSGANAVYQKAANAAHDAAQKGDLTAMSAVLDKYEQASLKFASGAKASSHVKWGAQVHQYVTQAKADVKAKTSATATADKLAGPQKLSAMKYEGGKPGGSNPGGMYSDAEGKWLVKGSNAGDATDRSKNEVLASKLMAAVGAGAPDMKLVDLEGKHGGGIGVASKWLAGGVALDAKNPAHVAAAQADFAVHAWLANYDVLGLSMDNTQIIGGKAVNIDPGGALLYRAQGQPKGDKFTTKATEFDSLRDASINPNGAKIYGAMTASQLAASAEKLKAIDDDSIIKLVQTYGPGDDIGKSVLAAKLIARKQDILARVAALQPKVASTPAPAPASAPAPAVAAPAAASTTIQTFRYEMKEGGSNKWWQSAVVGNTLVTQYGKIGTKGSETVKTFANNADAKMAQMKLIKEKAQKGYQTVGMVDMTVTVPGAAPATPAAAAPTAVPKTPPAMPTFTGIHQEQYKAVARGLSNLSASDLQAAFQSTGKGGKLVLTAGGTKVTINNPPKSPDGKAIWKFYLGLQEAGGKAPPAPPAAPPAAPASPIDKPTQWPFAGKSGYYNDLANKAAQLHASGDLAGLKAMPNAGGGKNAWPAGSANGKVMSTYHSALVADLEKKQASQTMATVQAAQAAVAQPVVPPAKGTAPNGAPMPDFGKFKLPMSNSNAPSHNAKVDKIAELAGKGDVKGLLSLNYGTNNYAKKQVQLANDALAALGSPFAVTAGQKSNAHPSLLGGNSPLKVQQAAAVSGQPAPTPHPATQGKPDMTKLDTSKAVAPPKPHFDKSSKAWVNESNNKLAAEIAAKFAAGDYNALQAMKYQEIDKETGKLGGFKHMSEHPAKDLKGFYDANLAVMREVAYPPKPLKVFQAQHAATVKAIDAAFPPKPFGTTVNKVNSNEKVGFWVALGKVDDVKAITPGKTQPISKADSDKAYQDYAQAPKLAKAFINGIQSSGSYNDLFRDGKEKDFSGNKLSDVAEAALAYAQTKPAGTRITRWQHMSADMIKKLESSGPGTVLQATGSMCCSKSDTATKGFGPHKITIVYADGAKAVDSFGSGNYQGEQEVTTLPNARFVVLKVAKQSNGNSDVTLLMLPPNLGLKKPPGI